MTSAGCGRRKQSVSSTGNLKTDSEHIEYTPTVFLRCHSKKTEAVDRHTQVWQCAFEPDGPFNNNNSVFATCGGNSICIINAVDGSVKTKHYAKESEEDLTALAWTTLSTLDKPINILAVAGRKFVLHLLNPDEAVCFAEHALSKTSRKIKASVESLLFHPKQPSILFGVSSLGDVFVWDIGNPHPPYYKSALDVLQVIHLDCHANALTFSLHCNMLLCATQWGVVSWSIPETTLQKNQNFKEVRFCLPCTNENIAPEDKYYVDSIETIEDGKLIATKCALHGYIYIWNLEGALKMSATQLIKEIKIKALIVDPLHTLKWSNTDNFYMSIGVDARGKILACGDDIGNLWVYDIDEILALPRREHDCSTKLEWPHVEDQKSQRRKMNKTSEIVVNKVSFSNDANFLIAVTNTNIVCIWEREY